MTAAAKLQPVARAVLRSQSDDRLVALSREGRDAAFEEIVRRYRPGLVAFAAAYAPPDRAEDVVQESFLGSWRALRASTERIHLKAWLYTIVRNRALNARRDARSHQPLGDELDGVAGPPEVVMTNDELARVVTAVGALPRAQRKALVRSALEGRTHEQIASELGATPGAVRQLIYRGRVAVRQGVGLLLPLPLVRTLVELGSGAAAATGAAAGGGVAAAGGASLLSKGAVVAVVGAIVAGSGVAIERSLRSHRDPAGADRARAQAATPNRGAQGPRGSVARSSSPVAIADPSSSGPGGSPGSLESAGRRGGSADDDHSGPGSGDDSDDDSGPGSGDDSDDDSGPGEADASASDDDDSGSPGPGHGGSGSGSDDDPPELDDDNSGPGSAGSGSGSAGSGSGGSGGGSSGTGSGTGGGDDLDDDPPEVEVDSAALPVEPDDNSGTGSTSGSSGSSISSGSGTSSGSGSGELDELEVDD